MKITTLFPLFNNFFLKRELLISLLCLFICTKNNVFAQSGYIDTTFEKPLYDRFGTGTRAQNVVNTSLLLPDGKIMIGGDFSSYNGVACDLLARLNSDGSLDSSFHFQSPFTSIITMALLPDGKILLAGSGTLGVIKIHPNGDWDTSFQVSAIGGYVREMVLQSDQKILIGGSIYSFNGYPHNDLLRLNTNGTIDTTFDIDGGVYFSYHSIYSVACQTDGKILVGGDFTYYDSVPTGRIVRLNNDGSRDLTFDTGVGLNDIVLSIQIQSDNKIIATGYFNEFNGLTKHGIIRLLPNGVYDASFSNGLGAPNIHTVRLKSNGEIVIGGNFSSYDSQSTSNVAVLSPNGILQVSTTNVGGSEVKTLLIQPDNKIFVGGNIMSLMGVFTINGATRIMPNGDLDSSFVPWTGSSGQINDMVLLPNDKTIIVGDFLSYDGYSVSRIARLNVDGTLDQSFDPGTGANDVIYSLVVQSDGKLLIGGNFTLFNGIIRNKLARLNSDGSLDLTFNPGNGPELGFVRVVELEPSGKILVGGNFYYYNGVTAVSAVRLNPNGSLDASFSTGINGGLVEVRALALQPDGKIIVSSHYYNGSFGNNHTLRLHSNGIIDTSYNRDTQLNFNVNVIKLQSDGKIIVGGNMTISSGNIARLNADGTIDPSFNAGSGIDNIVHDICLLSSGQYIVAGEFDEYDGHLASNLVRINADGTYDNTFQTQVIDYGSNIRDVRIKPNGQLLVSGFFYDYNGKPAHCITRLNHDISGTSNMNISFDSIIPVTCTNSGNITATPLLGVPPYNFEWQTFPLATTQSIQPNESGFYSVIVTDSTGYSDQKTILLSGYESTTIDLVPYLNYGEFRPGFSTNIFIEAVNNGCIPTDCNLKLVLPNLLLFNSANPPPSYTSGDTLFWQLPQLLYNLTQFIITVNVTTSTSAIIGDSIELNAIVSPLLNDEHPENNKKSVLSPIVNSFDPNNIIVYPIGKCEDHFVDNQQRITYTINFQNTGNSEAINVNIIDSISAFLDISTVRLINQSHPLWIELLSDNVLKFHFDNIHLADSGSNETGSHGYFTFEIDQLLGLNTGMIITNQAEIYFDYNSPIETNTVFNSTFSDNLETFSCDLDLNNIENAENIIIFPNPIENNFTINRLTDNLAIITLRDLDGKVVVSTFKTNEQIILMECAHLQNGIYILQIETELSETVIKIVKR